MRIILTHSARSDLFLLEENLNYFNGDGTFFVNQITKEMTRLSTFPKIGPSLQTKITIPTDYRFLTFKFTNKQIFIIIYRVDEKAKIIYINRVFDARTNYLYTLFQD